MYILAGILPEDKTKGLPRERKDELAPLKRLVSRTVTEAAKHRDYAKVEDLSKALMPLAPLLRDVSTDLGQKGKHDSAWEY